jgi:hypothetical protein
MGDLSHENAAFLRLLRSTARFKATRFKAANHWRPRGRSDLGRSRAPRAQRGAFVSYQRASLCVVPEGEPLCRTRGRAFVSYQRASLCVVPEGEPVCRTRGRAFVSYQRASLRPESTWGCRDSSSARRRPCHSGDPVHPLSRLGAAVIAPVHGVALVTAATPCTL